MKDSSNCDLSIQSLVESNFQFKDCLCTDDLYCAINKLLGKKCISESEESTLSSDLASQSNSPQWLHQKETSLRVEKKSDCLMAAQTCQESQHCSLLYENFKKTCGRKSEQCQTLDGGYLCAALRERIRRIPSCLEVAEACVGDAVCNAQLALYLKACLANGNLCDVNHCQAAIRFFYQNMPLNIAQMLAFCDCTQSDIPCQQSREALHSKPCAVNIVPPPTCLNVIHSCRNDELCRRRYRTFQSKCWQRVTRKCHEDETCISTLSKQDLTCSGSDACRAAYI
ncbi:hypothetical protein MC885_017678, partial [Smutsia gigantea]